MAKASTTKPAKKTPATKKASGKPAERKPRGRPSTFDQGVADKILARLSVGEPLAVICRDEDMPAVRTVSDWKKARPAFSADFARARDDGFDAIAAECLAIAEDGSKDYVTKTDQSGGTYEAFDSEHVQRSKIRIETRLKLLAKWDPRRYGDRLQVEADVGVHTMSDDQLNRRLAELAAAATGAAAAGTKARTS